MHLSAYSVPRASSWIKGEAEERRGKDKREEKEGKGKTRARIEDGEGKWTHG